MSSILGNRKSQDGLITPTWQNGYMAQPTQYTEDNIRSLDWKEHIRMRPGMYIGKLGDGSSADDGIYILLKEVLDNSIDEYVMGAGKTIEISIQGNR